MATIFAVLLVLAASVNGQPGQVILDDCARHCRNQTELMDKCNIPPLDSNYTSRPRTTLDDGAEVDKFDSREQANCYCTQGRFSERCSSCITDKVMADRSLRETDIFRNWDELQSDCLRLGFYPDDVIGYPSTTRTALPSATPTAGACGEECRLLRGQIDGCQLTPLDHSPFPPRERHTLRYWGSVLLNRTAGECTCTTPVLNAMPDCLQCLYDNASRMLWTSGKAYDDDCKNLGYRVKGGDLFPPETSATTSGPAAGETSQSGSDNGDGNGAGRTSGHVTGALGLVVLSALAWLLG